MEHEGNITPPTYPAPKSVAQFAVDLFATGESLCCNCHEVCHKCGDEGEVAEEVEPKKSKKGK